MASHLDEMSESAVKKLGSDFLMQPQPGTDAFVLACRFDQPVEIGKLGRLHARPGFYVYVGSAFGPGGLRARIAHHLKISAKPRWHLDYLRPLVNPSEIWLTYDSRQREHQWAGVLAGISGAAVPFLGFGASDCRCESHLYFFSFRPSAVGFQRRVHATLNPHAKIFIKNLLTK
jgi:Uri superfamily endonuclease